MSYYDVANHVTLTKTNLIRQNALGSCEKQCCENMAPILLQSYSAVSAALEVSRRAAQWTVLLSKSPTDLHRGLRSSKSWLVYKWNWVASWMHLPNCRCFQEHLRMRLQSLRALRFAPVGSGCIKEYFEALVWSPGVSARIVCCFRTNFHFADVQLLRSYTDYIGSKKQSCNCHLP